MSIRNDDAFELAQLEARASAREKLRAALEENSRRVAAWPPEVRAAVSTREVFDPLPVQYLVDVSPWSACSDDPLLECFGDACDASSPLPIDDVEIDPYYADEVTL